MRTAVIIPARLESLRLPRKLLLRETGNPLLWYAWLNANETPFPVYIATDSQEITKEAEDWSAQVIQTHSFHKNGTSRIVEALNELSGIDLIINLQGDHPNVLAKDLVQLESFMRSHSYDMGTLITNIREDEYLNLSVVKVAFSGERALYFSRGALAGGKKHVGVYAYWRKTLQMYKRLPDSYLGECENLEQLVWLEAGMSIGVVPIDHSIISVDTRDDYERFCQTFTNN